VFVGGVISLYHYNNISGNSFTPGSDASQSYTVATESYPVLVKQAIQQNSLDQGKLESVSSRLFLPLLVAEYYQK
jgi:hypothetical protein